jgi:hypothetical protein
VHGQLELFGEQGAQHQSFLIDRRIPVGFGFDVEAIGREPARSACNLKVGQVVRKPDERRGGYVRAAQPPARLRLQHPALIS